MFSSKFSDSSVSLLRLISELPLDIESLTSSEVILEESTSIAASFF